MTKSTITRERIELIANFHRAMTLPPSHDEIEELARMTLVAMDSEPVAWTWHYREQWHVTNDKCRAAFVAKDGDVAVLPLYRHAQPVPVVPENCVTAEHRRVIEMLLNVCGAAFELADDSCQQDVGGEDCHVVPDDAFQKLSDALDEIENTLPTEDIDRPDVFLAWSAMPRAALKSLLQAQPAPVVPEEKSIPNTLSMYAVDAVAAIAEVKGWNACRAAMLQELKKSAGTEAICRSDENVQVLHTKSPAQSDCCPAQNHVSPEQNGDTPAQSQGWIQVSEQMPPSRHEVLVGRWWGEKPRWCCKWATYIPGHPDAQSSGWLIPGASWTPTHWMPLPAAPQEVKSES